MGPYIIAITGASGAIYGLRLLEWMLRERYKIYLIVTEEAKYIIREENGIPLEDDIALSICRYYGITGEDLHYFEEDDLTAPIASGSTYTEGMIVVPCSMKVVSSIACGFASNLVERAADVVLKERRSLIIVPRETPLNSIHLRNLLTLSELGAHIIPAMPAFYHRPKTVEEIVDFVVGRILDSLKIQNDLYQRWKG